MTDRATAARERVRAHRQRRRESGLRLVQYWVPDTRSPEWKEKVRQDCLRLNASRHAEEDEAWVDAVSAGVWRDEPWHEAG